MQTSGEKCLGELLVRVLKLSAGEVDPFPTRFFPQTDFRALLQDPRTSHVGFLSEDLTVDDLLRLQIGDAPWASLNRRLSSLVILSNAVRGLCPDPQNKGAFISLSPDPQEIVEPSGHDHNSVHLSLRNSVGLLSLPAQLGGRYHALFPEEKAAPAYPNRFPPTATYQSHI